VNRKFTIITYCKFLRKKGVLVNCRRVRLKNVRD
jgi:hypothetical protein